MTEARLILGDCLEVMAGMQPDSIDAIVTDPPYGLEFMGKEWDRLGDRRQPGDVTFHPSGVGPFDRAKVRYGYVKSMAPMQEWHYNWAVEAIRVLKPAHYLVAFGGTRTHHRLMCALEDAGFEIRDTLMWLYGSGFPKGKGHLKPAFEPVVLAQKPHCISSLRQTFGRKASEWESSSGQMDTSGSASGVENAAWSTILLWKHILDAVSEAMRTSTIATEIERTTDWKTLNSCLSAITLDSIIPDLTLLVGLSLSASPAARYFNAECMRLNAIRERSAAAPATEPVPTSPLDAIGRGFRPNFTPIILCRKPGAKVRPLGIDECRIGTEPVVSLKGLGNNRNLNDDGWKGIGHVPEPTTNIGRWPANLILDETSGAMLDEQSGQTAAGHFPARRAGIGYQSGALGQEGLEARSTDSGGASRFFYCPKASRAERNAGCEGLERKVYAPSGGAQGAAARSEEYDKGQGIGLNRVSMRQNHHPTVKPVALMAWLVRLIAPPSATVLDPFMGSGTTGVAAVQEGREFIGIEREPEYLAIAEARIKNATRQGVLL